MSEKISLLKLNKQAWLVVFLIVVYVCGAIFCLIRVNRYTQEIYDFPFTVSTQARIMKSRLYDFRNVLPGSISSQEVSMDEIERTLQIQENLQLTSLAIIEKHYCGELKELAQIRELLTEMRNKRRELIEMTWNDPVEKIFLLYPKVVGPTFKKLESLLSMVAETADKHGEEIHQESRRTIFIILSVSLLGGIALIWYILAVAKTTFQTNRRISQRDRLLRLLCATVNNVYFIYSSEGEPRFVSSNTEQFLGIPDHAFKEDKDLLINTLKPEDAKWLRTCLEDKTAHEFAPRLITIEGNKRYFKLHVYPMSDNDSHWFVVSLADETDQVEYQKNLGDALQSAQNASQSKTQFLSHMSHEIRTPMNAIIGMTTIALAKINDKVRVEDCLKKTIQASKHLMGLINDILDMSKIESNKLILAQEAFNIRDLVHNLTTLIEPQARAKGIIFEPILENIKQEGLIGDPLRMNQILLNILSNAIKFTPNGGKVTLKITEKVTSPHRVHMNFEISDTGIGMKEDFLQRVFHPFEQASAEVTQKYGGSGLGLAITYNLVSLMGGTISVKSKLGVGTTFNVNISLGLTEKESLIGKELQELKTLVVDDDKDACEHACLLLSQLGQNTDFALSGREGIDKIENSLKQNDPYDVCFLDWKMPEMDGEETAREIRKIVGPETLIIIISAFDWSPIETRAREAGVNGFIAKPFFTSSLYDCLISAQPNIKKNSHKAVPELFVDQTDKKSRILLVEDNVFNAEVAQEFLEMAGYEVELAVNGAKAIDAFRSHKCGYYDLIFMDIQMPVMDGLTATRKIRELDRDDAKKIPIIAMTANAFTDDVSKSLEAGMNDHISKPLDLKVLHQILGTYLGKMDKNLNLTK